MMLRWNIIINDTIMHLPIYTFSSPSTDKSSCVTLTGSTPSPAHLSCFPRLLHSIPRITCPPEAGCGFDLQVIKEARAAAAASLHPSFLIYEMTLAVEPTFQGIVGLKSTTESFSLFETTVFRSLASCKCKWEWCWYSFKRRSHRIVEAFPQARDMVFHPGSLRKGPFSGPSPRTATFDEKNQRT